MQMSMLLMVMNPVQAGMEMQMSMLLMAMLV
jgi:hypothetical protein